MHVHFHDNDRVLYIEVPIEDNKYITGNDLHEYIMSFKKINDCTLEIKKPLKGKNADEILNLVDTHRQDIYEDNLERLKNINLRIQLLASSDWTQLPDAQAQWDEEDKQLWLEYRQALRDITKQPGWPRNVDWPKRPHILGVVIFE